MQTLEEKIASSMRDICDFPVKGVVFKDITPILKNIPLVNEILDSLAEKFKNSKIDKIAAIESRGFLFAMPLAIKMSIPFVPIRKKGKLPAEIISQEYDLEYGKSVIEIHKDALSAGENVLIIDDLLATGGTLNASIDLMKKLGACPVAAAFVIELVFLNGVKHLQDKSVEVFSILKCF